MALKQNKHKKILWLGLAAVWLSHLVGVFTPEVGFDAVWYHLPVAKAIVEQGKLVYLPELYQSVNPLLSDIFFTIGYWLGGELGAKAVAYLFGLSLLAASYKLSRQFLTRTWGLWLILLVSTFQVVAWQSSSFYVDVAKTSWELWSLYWLLRWWHGRQPRQLIASGLLFGFSLGTKLFSLILWPLMIAFVWPAGLLSSLIFIISSLLPALPFYWFAWQQTGQPFYSLVYHLQQLERIGSGSNLLAHVGRRTLELYQLPGKILWSHDYTTFILLLFLPFLIKFWSKLWSKRKLRILFFFTVWQIGLWWYLPPLSTRYGLAGFISWLILVLWAARREIEQQRQYYWPIVISLSLAILINFAPRLYVNYRSWRYLSGQQNKQQYLEQFLDGNLDVPLKAWYQF